MAGMAKALHVRIHILAAERQGLDVVDHFGGAHQAALRALGASGMVRKTPGSSLHASAAAHPLTHSTHHETGNGHDPDTRPGGR